MGLNVDILSFDWKVIVLGGWFRGMWMSPLVDACSPSFLEVSQAVDCRCLQEGVQSGGERG
jgi:hypothetical protein